VEDGRSLFVLNIRGEESPDFTGKDTSEMLGAERLRKVPQKTDRQVHFGGVGRMKIPA